MDKQPAPIAGVDRALIYGSWAARFSGHAGHRPVEDIDLLVLGDPSREEVYAAVGRVERRLGREVQVTIRDKDWLERGSGSFHTNVSDNPRVELTLTPSRSKADSSR